MSIYESCIGGSVGPPDTGSVSQSIEGIYGNPETASKSS